MSFRSRLTQHLGEPAKAQPAGRAEDWLRGRADLLIAGMGGQVPAVVQLGDLAHADLDRLADLGRNSRLGSVRRHGEPRCPASPAILPASRPPPSGSLRCSATC